VKLLYFAWVRQKTGVGEETFEAPPSVTTITQLIETLRARGPNYAEAFRRPEILRFAVNQHHVGPDAIIAPGDEIAFFPPVTGG
jgi:molybdopterin synthase sulfur carrier subunit